MSMISAMSFNLGHWLCNTVNDIFKISRVVALYDRPLRGSSLVLVPPRLNTNAQLQIIVFKGAAPHNTFIISL